MFYVHNDYKYVIVFTCVGWFIKDCRINFFLKELFHSILLYLWDVTIWKLDKEKLYLNKIKNIIIIIIMESQITLVSNFCHLR